MADNGSEDRSFSPVVRDGRVMAGGKYLFSVDRECHARFPDRFTPRSGQRGNAIAVPLEELLRAIITHLEDEGT